jgi:hypothetical protein
MEDQRINIDGQQMKVDQITVIKLIRMSNNGKAYDLKAIDAELFKSRINKL